MQGTSKKDKGRRFENYLVGFFRETIDSGAFRTAGSGAGLDKNDVRLPKFNIEIEAKNQKSISLYDTWEQVKSQITTGNTPVMAFRNPKKPEFEETFIVLEVNDFVEILQRASPDNEVKITTTFDRDFEYKLNKMKSATHDVLSYLKKKGRNGL